MRRSAGSRKVHAGGDTRRVHIREFVDRPGIVPVIAGPFHVTVHEQDVHAAGDVVEPLSLSTAAARIICTAFVVHDNNVRLGLSRTRWIVDVGDAEALDTFTQAPDGDDLARRQRHGEIVVAVLPVNIA